MRQKFLLFALLFNGVVEFLSKAINQEKEIKGIWIEKKEITLFLFAEDTIIYLKDPKDPTKNFVDVINTFSKIAEYKFNK
jgi:hypothetical protein